MAHIGLICPEISGHLNPMAALGRELRCRGHRVTLVGIPDGERKAAAAGLAFHPVGAAEFPRGYVAAFSAVLGRLSGLSATRLTARHYVRSARVTLREGPQAIRALGIDLLLVDQTSVAGGTIADRLGLPFVSVANALLLNEEPYVPPLVVRWRYGVSWTARVRNRLGYLLFHWFARGLSQVVNRQRREWKLPPHRALDDTFSKLAQIVQIPREFDFPRTRLPQCVHYTGPLVDSASREPVAFPWERLRDDRPMVYASMGTLQNRHGRVFRAIAEACADLDVQLVISLGGADASVAAGLPAGVVVVPFAPQLELLARARLTITHAGLNTTMESLTHGTPLVAIPITNDQPGVASRVVWTGTGRVVSYSRLTAEKLRWDVERVLTTESYVRNAARMQEAIARAGGVARAADVVETVLATGQPVACAALPFPLKRREREGELRIAN